MKSLLWLSLLLGTAGALALTAASSAPAPLVTSEDAKAGTYEIDPVHSSVVFRIAHMGIANFYGSFEAIKGEITIADKAEDCKVFVELDANSIDTNNKQRDDHVRGPEFFNVAEFPAIIFESTKVKKAGAKFTVTGNLEFHGVSKEVTVDMQLIGAKDLGESFGGYKAGFEGKVTVDRTLFGVTNYEDALGKDVELTLSIEAAKKK
jgi:polyisoprenoid-binding protein YceI